MPSALAAARTAGESDGTEFGGAEVCGERGSFCVRADEWGDAVAGRVFAFAEEGAGVVGAGAVGAPVDAADPAEAAFGWHHDEEGPRCTTKSRPAPGSGLHY